MLQGEGRCGVGQHRPGHVGLLEHEDVREVNDGLELGPECAPGGPSVRPDRNIPRLADRPRERSLVLRTGRSTTRYPRFWTPLEELRTNAAFIYLASLNTQQRANWQSVDKYIQKQFIDLQPRFYFE